MIVLGRAFFILIVLEILVFGLIVDAIGFWAALLLWFFSAAIGGFILQNQGIKNLEKGRDYWRRGILPEDNLFENFCLLAAGLLLIFPGFVSDAMAFCLMIPAVRTRLKAWIVEKIAGKTGTRADYPMNGEVIDGDYVRVEEVQITSTHTGEEKP